MFVLMCDWYWLLQEHRLLDQEVQIHKAQGESKIGSSVDGQAVPERLEWHFALRGGSPPTPVVVSLVPILLFVNNSLILLNMQWTGRLSSSLLQTWHLMVRTCRGLSGTAARAQRDRPAQWLLKAAF